MGGRMEKDTTFKVVLRYTYSIIVVLFMRHLVRPGHENKPIQQTNPDTSWKPTQTKWKHFMYFTPVPLHFRGHYFTFLFITFN